MIEVICADVVKWAREYDGPPFHAMLCDAPYQYGFMGKSWDADGVSYKPETWAALAEHLHPGAFGMTFGGARSWHRIACAIEDAGLIIHPTIFVWLQAQGFPKATRIDTQVDAHGGQSVGWFGSWLREWRQQHGITQKELAKHFPSKTGGLTGCVANWELGYNLPTVEQFNRLVKAFDLPFHTIEEMERKVIGKGYDCGKRMVEGGMLVANESEWDITLPATDLARIWEGHRYGLQAMKPAVEPIIVFQKPYEGRPVDCITETGAGAIWVDGARVGMGDTVQVRGSAGMGYQGSSEKYKLGEGRLYRNQGRWPPNFCLVHAPGCRRVGMRRVKSGGGSDRLGYTIREGENYTRTGAHGVYGQFEKPIMTGGYADADGTEEVADWECEEGCPCAKLGEQSGESKSSGGSGQATLEARERHFKVSKGDFNDVAGLGGYGDKGTAARFFYQADWEHERAEMACSPECPVAKLDEQVGERKSGGDIRGNRPSEGVTSWVGREYITHKDAGGASRFYHNADWSHEIAEQLAQSDPVRYCPKAAKRERSSGLDDFYWRKDKKHPIGFARISREEWEALGEEEERIHKETGKRVRLRARGNIHSTVKPISLLVWLCKLLAPPKEYAPRRILIPFSGSGSEMAATVLSNCWEEAVGIELYEDYCEIAKSRIAFWSAKSQETGSSDLHAILKTCDKKDIGKQDSPEHSPSENSAQMSLEL